MKADVLNGPAHYYPRFSEMVLPGARAPRSSIWGGAHPSQGRGMAEDPILEQAWVGRDTDVGLGGSDKSRGRRPWRFSAAKGLIGPVLCLTSSGTTFGGRKIFFYWLRFGRRLDPSLHARWITSAFLLHFCRSCKFLWYHSTHRSRNEFSFASCGPEILT
jgi:hypothetical protein